jgi:pimeloyl-ACP methyl ester carboxylesterase
MTTPAPATTGRLVVDDGVGIAYQTWGRPAALPVLLHHGFAADATSNFVAPGVVAGLVTAGRYVVAPDARGHGASDKPHDDARYGEDRMARDLLQLADALAPDGYDLVGYSMGAIVALLVAAQDPRVRRLVVGGVGSGVLHSGGVDQRAVRRGLIAEALLADDPATVPPEAAAFRALADALGCDRLALAAQARRAWTGGVALGAITAATLVVAGDSDPLAAQPQELADAIPGAQLRVLPGDHISVLGDPAFVPTVVAAVGSGG